MRNGFRIGFNWRAAALKPGPSNFQSVNTNRATVDDYLAAEQAEGKVAQSSLADIHCSPIGLIPKPHQPGKYRLIVNLSSPHGASVNDGIAKDLCSLEYATIDQAAAVAQSYRVGALMAKLDLRSAYRRIPVHPDDQELLGIEWQGTVFLDRALPFGLRSAPKIFNAVADALAWAMLQSGVNLTLHYLDDFFFCGEPNSNKCSHALGTALPLASS